MFLSSTDQSPSNNPSSSSSFLHLTNSSDELGQSHLSSFSIRDYAFSYRTKNIKKNWPFSSTSLQLCLRHGLSDPLPPIQPLGRPLQVEKLNITYVEAISNKRKAENLSVNQTLVETNKQGFENGLLASGSKSKIQVAMANKNPRKKCGLVVKPGACMDSGSKEDHSCLFSASESMALRTCPICKTFSSASNTTLNAHIDQCLSVDSEQQPMTKPNRPRTKPRLKVKTMIDIYASAKAGTLEDLDKRNGTNWVMISSFSNGVVSDSKPEVSNKGKKRSVVRVRIDEEAAGIGPVYIDAKGQKLRILSEFSEKTSDPSIEHEDGSEKKSSSESKGNKSFRKKLKGKNYYKYPKPVRQSRKLTVRKGNALEISDYGRGYSDEGKDFERLETSGPSQRRIFNQRMLTKRRLTRHGNKIGTKICDQPENGDSLSEDHLVLRGPSNVNTDLSETVSSPLNSQGSWRICGEKQVSGKSLSFSRNKSIESDSFVASPVRCSTPVDKEFSSKAKGIMKFKKARLGFSENEDEDTGKWESEMTQECDLTDYDDWDDDGEPDKVVLSSNPSFSGEDNDYESDEETGNNKGDDDMLHNSNDADVEFENMIYEKTGCETAEQESSFMEVDPIPIPGPPGSFLPSPWDMATDAIEHHGNSSVITSQVHSSQDQLDLTDRNSSESPVSAISNFAAPETQIHNIITIDKRPSRFRDNDQSCCCQRQVEETAFGQPPPPPHMTQQDLDFLSKPVPVIPSNPNPVLRLMGKDLMVINQREEEPSHNSPKPTSQFQDLSKTQQVSSSVLHRPYGGNGSYFDTNTSFYNI
ncbi:hypothetical protein CARUB_v10025899mg [Capsella rubella]|uniref:UBZ4-type domain-containing protein n=1 Tax=Capsella rubella TaxID=81985 RepID=R0EVR9_9BRAS|nr:uncharacterized protein LOC17875346 [Capsella rubella]EOA12921.1 hypothetical protein CARUB_v10025899mg [Capsella rubella]